MHLRAFHTLALIFLCLKTAAFAGLEITSANYGSRTSYRDVRGVIAAYVRSNVLSFPVNARSMGGDPTRGESDFLFIIYKVNGREFRDVVAEGKTFTFQGVPSVIPVRPPLNLPFLRPPSPSTVPFTIVNRSGNIARLYCVDRYQQWVWAADIPDGQTISLTAQIGQHWIATDESNRILARERSTRDEKPMMIDPPDVKTPAGGFRGEEAWVRFENTSYHPLYLYNLDFVGRWNWMATLEPGGGYSASTHVGTTWIATNTANRVVRQTIVGPGMSRVKLY